MTVSLKLLCQHFGWNSIMQELFLLVQGNFLAYSLELLCWVLWNWSFFVPYACSSRNTIRNQIRSEIQHYLHTNNKDAFILDTAISLIFQQWRELIRKHTVSKYISYGIQALFFYIFKKRDFLFHFREVFQ